MPDFMVQPANVFANFAAGRQMRQGEEQQALQNQFAMRHQEMQEAEFQAQQEALARQRQFDQLAGEFLGPELEMAGGLQPGGAAPAPRPSFSQLATLDPERAMQLQAFQAQRAAAARQQEQEKAKEIVLSAQYALRSEAPATLLRIGFPDLVQQLASSGVDVDTLDDDTVRGYAQTLIEHFGPVAGLAPESADGEQFTLGEGQTRFDAQGRPIASVARQPETDDANQLFQRANTLRDEFNAATKDFSTIEAQHQNILATSRSPSAAGDIALITSYMRMLDPMSTVREGEFANAQNAAGVSDRIRAQYNKLLKGERLSSAQRADFVSQAGNVFESRQKQHSKSLERYANLAKRAGVDPLDVVGTAAAKSPSDDGWSITEE